MTTEKIPIRVQHKRMTASQWASSSLVLLEGEIGVESDTGFAKIGDGRSRFSALKYLSGPKGDNGRSPYVHTAYATISFICNENQSFTLSRTTMLRYGKNESWVYKELGAGTYRATTDLFGQGDPAHGITKAVESVSDFSTTNSNNRSHLGIYVDYVESGSNASSSYAWMGVRGEQGLVGPKGADGVVSFDALTPSQKASLKGDKGDKGERGEAGPMPTITINSSGIWEINGHSTGVSGRGQVGPKGSDGAKGDRGERGLTGETGPRGADGAPGQHILNQKTNQPLKYWFGSKADYDRIWNKDANTIYDVYE
ncbi:hypothetical protein ABPH35_02330 [Streptococcus sp. ZJ93]|uniref:hyaluronate lyase N-terminal domain-containing protein n=1 Tax=Streptococcus handemini TaxID=3161188 RepID=UPI0034D43C3F